MYCFQTTDGPVSIVQRGNAWQVLVAGRKLAEFASPRAAAQAVSAARAFDPEINEMLAILDLPRALSAWTELH